MENEAICQDEYFWKIYDDTHDDQDEDKDKIRDEKWYMMSMKELVEKDGQGIYVPLK